MPSNQRTFRTGKIEYDHIWSLTFAIFILYIAALLINCLPYLGFKKIFLANDLFDVALHYEEDTK